MSSAKKLFDVNNPIIIVEEISQASDYSLKATRSDEDSSAKTSENDLSASNSDLFECDGCDYSSHNKHYLKQHVELVHNSERRYKCPYCDYAGKRTHSLKEHLIVHSNERPFACHHCNATFRKKGHLTNHVKLHSSVRSSRCFICHEQFPEHANLDEHLRDVHKTKKVFMCALCSFTTPKHSNIVNHLESHHKWENLNFYMINEVLKCIECSFICNNSNEIIEHSKLHVEKECQNKSIDNLSIKCSECGFISNNPEVVKEHMWQHIKSSNNCSVDPKDQKTSAVNTSISTPSPPCKQDNSSQGDSPVQKSIKVKDRLKAHIKEMASIENLKSQPTTCLINMQSSVGKYTCAICGYSCVNQRTFKTHIWKHSGHKDIDYPMFQSTSGNVNDELSLAAAKTDLNKPVQLKSNSPNNENCSQSDSAKIPSCESSLVQILNSPLFQSQIKIIKTNDMHTECPTNGSYRDLPSSESQNESQTISLDTSLHTQSIDHLESPCNKDLQQTKDTYTSDKLQAAKEHSSSNSLSAEYIVKTVSESTTVPCITSMVSQKDSSVNQEMTSESAKCEEPSPEVNVQEIICDGTTEAKTNSHQVTEGAEKDSFDKSLDENESATGDSALTLLSLLKKGPNYNPACPFSTTDMVSSDLCVSATVTISDSSVESHTDTDSGINPPSKPKSGISSSLLAVIEQLRERSKSENEGSDSNITSQLSNKASLDQHCTKDGNVDKKSLKYLDNVETFRYGSEMRYRCKFCHYSNCSNSIMLQHMRLHKIKQPFECSLCEFVAKSSGNLQDHMIQHCKIRTYQCKVCPSVFNYKSQLRAHMRAHNDQDPYTCELCSFESSSSTHFINHMRKHSLKDDKTTEKRKRMKKGPGEAEGLTRMENKIVSRNGNQAETQKMQGQTLKCSDCDFTCSSTASFKIHAEKHIVKTESLKCQFCDFAAVSSRSLKSHMKRHINDQRYVQQPLEQYKCNLCGYVCHHLPSLKSHMWRHASNIDYSYEYTNEIINAAIDYDTQIENENANESTTQTSQSQSSQQRFDDMQDGIKEQSTEKPCSDKMCLVTFRCCQCGFETIFKPDLNKHMKMHSDIIQQTLDVSKCLEPVVFSQEMDKSP